MVRPGPWILPDSWTRDEKMKIGPHNIATFIAAFDAAKGDSFQFEGSPVRKSYAKHVIEYFASINLPMGKA